MDAFQLERIERANEEVVHNALARISTGDVIVTFGYSVLVEQVLLKAAKDGVKFKVIVLDSRPFLEGTIP